MTCRNVVNVRTLGVVPVYLKCYSLRLLIIQVRYGTPSAAARVDFSMKSFSVKTETLRVCTAGDSFVHSFIHSLCSMPNNRSIAFSKKTSSSFSLQYPLFSVRSKSSFLRLIPLLPVTCRVKCVRYKAFTVVKMHIVEF